MFPYPNLMKGATISGPGDTGFGFVAGDAGYGTLIGRGFVAASTAAVGYYPGGSISPDNIDSADFHAIHTIGAELIVAIAGSWPQNFFETISVPGVNGGAPIASSSATSYATGAFSGVGFDTVWRFAISGEAVSGTVTFT